MDEAPPKNSGSAPASGGCRNRTPTRIYAPAGSDKPHPLLSDSWWVNETYIRVSGKWCYLYRMVSRHGWVLGFYMSTKCNTAAATRLLGEAFRGAGRCGRDGAPRVICTDKALTYAAAIEKLIEGRKLSKTVKHRQVEVPQQRDRGWGSLSRSELLGTARPALQQHPIAWVRQAVIRSRVPVFTERRATRNATVTRTKSTPMTRASGFQNTGIRPRSGTSATTIVWMTMRMMTAG